MLSDSDLPPLQLLVVLSQQQVLLSFTAAAHVN